MKPSDPWAGLAIDNRYARLGEAYYTRLEPTPVPQPEILATSPAVARQIGLDPAVLRTRAFRDLAAGNATLPGGEPLSMVYAGHQFGVWVPQLGDGRAILLAQLRGPDGLLRDLQIKGGGRTPYSRFADGRAVLRSCVREFLASEAMAGLGIPTTRALAVATTGERIRRETIEPGATLLRVARSHIRFGHFEYFFHSGRFEQLGPLADHVIAEHHPELVGHADRHRLWLEAVTDRTAELIARWEAVGFVHGVMNTDNLSVIGETIDYGPYAFMEGFDPAFCPNHTDSHGRYAFQNQAGIAEWNLSGLLQACLPLLADEPQTAVEVGTAILRRFAPAHERARARQVRAKLGLAETRDDDMPLYAELCRHMEANRADYTRVHRALCGVTETGGDAPFLDEFIDRDGAAAWLADYRVRLNAESRAESDRMAAMRAVNPRYILRAHHLDHAIDRAGRGDTAEVEALLACLADPFADQPEFERFDAPRPHDAPPMVLSCSS